MRLYTYPDQVTKDGRRVVIHYSNAETREERLEAWQEYHGQFGMAEIGLAAETIVKAGFDWQAATSPEDVVALAEAVRDLAAQPLVVERQLPLSWLVDSHGSLLGVTSLSAISQAIELAELIDEDWRTLVRSTTAVNVILNELPRLQAKADAMTTQTVGNPAPAPVVAIETKIEAPAPIKAPTITVAVQPVAKPTPAAPSNTSTEPRLHGKARVEQRRREAEARKANATPPKPGEVFKKKGEELVICTGSRCLRTFPFAEARVAKSIKSVQHALGARRFDQITESNLPFVCLCPDCADRILKSGHQSIAEAIVARDEAIRAAEQWQAEHPRPTQAKKPVGKPQPRPNNSSHPPGSAHTV